MATDTAGAVDVLVLPDGKGFSPALRTLLTKAEQTHKAEIQIEPELARGFKSRLGKMVAAQNSLVDAEVTFSPELAKRSAQMLTADAKALNARITPVLTFDVELQRGAAQELKSAGMLAGKKAKPSLTFDVDLQAGAAQELKTAAVLASKKSKPSLAFDVDLQTGSAAELKAEARALSQRLSGSVPIKFDVALVSGAATQLKTQVKALATRLSGDTAVKFDVGIASGSVAPLRAEAKAFAARVNPVGKLFFVPTLQPGSAGQLRAKAVALGQQVDVPLGAEMRTGAVPLAKAKAQAAARAGKAVDVPLDADSPALAVKIKTIAAALSNKFSIDMNLRADTTQLAATMGAASAGGSGGLMMGALAGGAAIGIPAIASAGLFGASAKKSADFTEALADLKGTAGATDAQMKLLEAQALDLGASTAFSASEVVTAQIELIKAGVGLGDVLGGAVPGALGLAGAGALDLGVAAEITSNQLNAFGLKGKDATFAADVLAAGANKSATDVEGLGLGLSQSALGANSLGISMEETVGALSMFSQKGLEGSDAGTSFKTMLQRLVPATRKQGKQAEQLGLSFFDAQGNFVGLAEAANRMQGAFGHLTPEMRAAEMQAWFGTDAIRAANILYNEGAEGVEKWTSLVADSGYATELAATKLDNIKGDFEQLGGEFETAALVAGGKAMPQLRQAVKDVQKTVSELGPAFGDVVGPFAGLVAGLAGTGGEMLKKLLGPLGIFTDALGVGLAAAEPGLVALAGAAGELIVAFSPLLEVGGQIVGMLGEALAPAIAAFAEPRVVTAISEIALAMADILVALLPIVPPIITVVGYIAALTAKLLTFKPVVMVITGLFAAWLLTTLPLAGSLMAISWPVTAVVLAIAALAAGVMYAYKNFEPFRNAVDAVGRFLADKLWPAIKKVASVVGGAFMDAWDKVWPVIKKVGTIIGKIYLTPIITAAKVLAKVFTGDFAGAWEAIKNGFATLKNLYGELGTILGELLSKLGTWFTSTAVPFIVEKGGILLTAAIGWVSEYAPKAIVWLGEALLAIGVWIVGTAVPWMAEKALQLGGAILGWVVEFAPKAIMWLGQALIALGAWFVTTAIPWLVTQSIALGGAILGWVVEFAPKAIVWLGEALIALGVWFVGTAIPWMATKAVELLGAIVGWAVEFAPKAIGFLGEALVSLASWFVSTAIPWALEKGFWLVVNLVKGLVSLPIKLLEALTAAFEWLVPKMGEIALGVIEWFKGLPGRLVGAAIALKDQLVSWAGTALSWLVTNLPRLVGAVLDWFKGLPGWLIEKVGGFKEQLVLWMAHAWIWLRDNLPGIAAGVFNWFRDLPGKIVETIGNVGEFLFNKGKDLMGGLLRGIGSAFTGLKDLAGGAFNWIAKIWNNTVGELSFTVPDIIGVPGRGETYSMPKLPTYESFHTGGVVPGRRDQERTVTVLGQETVFTRDQTRALGIAVRSVGAGAPGLGVSPSAASPAQQRDATLRMSALAPPVSHRAASPTITRGALEELRRIVNRASPEAPASSGGEGDEMRTVKHIIELVVSGDKATLSKLDRRELMAMLREVFRTAEGRRVAAEAMANAG